MTVNELQDGNMLDCDDGFVGWCDLFVVAAKYQLKADKNHV